MNITVWRVNGDKVDQSIPTHNRMKTIEDLIGWGCAYTDSVDLRDGRVMIVDDNGIAKGLPVNPAATELVQSIYPRYKKFDQKIYGDVVIAIDADFA